MPIAIILIPIVIIVGIVLLSSSGDIFSNFNFSFPKLNLGFKLPPLRTSLSTISSSDTSQKPQTSLQSLPTNVLLNTVISSPVEGTKFVFTTTVTFEFEAQLPSDNTNPVSYQTKIDDIDTDWVPTSSTERVITLPSGPREYTFSVRTVQNGAVDPTPATRTIQINTSPYFGKVEIKNLNPPDANGTSSITLRANLSGNDTVNITGWRLDGQEDDYTIPDAIDQFSTFNRSAMQRTDIILDTDSAVVISPHLNPLGSNLVFQSNQCFGYLVLTRNFPFAVTQTCPDVRPAEEDLFALSPACQDFITSFPNSCTMPAYRQNKTVFSDFDCFSYVQALEDRYTYEYCYQEHHEDTDFKSNIWYLYTDGETFLRRGHDRIFLYDTDGLFVHEYIY